MIQMNLLPRSGRGAQNLILLAARVDPRTAAELLKMAERQLAFDRGVEARLLLKGASGSRDAGDLGRSLIGDGQSLIERKDI